MKESDLSDMESDCENDDDEDHDKVVVVVSAVEGGTIGSGSKKKG